jgi:hypothetical protein
VLRACEELRNSAAKYNNVLGLSVRCEVRKANNCYTSKYTSKVIALCRFLNGT